MGALNAIGAGAPKMEAQIAPLPVGCHLLVNMQKATPCSPRVTKSIAYFKNIIVNTYICRVL